MAQYRKNFYGSSFYGQTTAFSSVYTSAIFDAQEVFEGQIRVRLSAQTPTQMYVAGDKELNGSLGAVGTKMTFIGSTRKVGVHFQGKTSGEFRLRTSVLNEAGQWVEETSRTVSMVGSGNQVAWTTTTGYKERLVDIEVLSGTMTFNRLEAEASDYVIEIGTSATTTGTSFVWERMSIEGSGDKEAFTANKVGIRYVRFRVTLASSDDRVAPKVSRVELLSGDANTRATNGRWQGRFNMDAIAQAQGKTFVRLLQVDWGETKPETTDIVVRSRGAASAGSTNFGPETARYRKSYRRIRLPQNATQGFAYMRNPIDIRQLLGQFNANRQWRDIWDVKSLPSSVSGQRISYEFYDAPPTGTVRPIAVIEANQLSRGKLPAVLTNEAGGRSFYLGVRLEKTLSEATPVVDWLTMSADVDYREKKSYKGDVSAVDNGDGKKRMRVMASGNFGWPTNANGNAANTAALASQRTLSLTDRSGRQGLSVYFKSKETTTNRLTSTKLNDEVWAEAKGLVPPGQVGPVDANPLYLHYHYNGGAVQYPHTDENELGSDFTPSLVSGRRYRYHIQNGWPDRQFQLTTAMSWTEAADEIGTDEATLRALNPGKLEYEDKLLIGQWLVEPNESLNPRAEVLFDTGSYTETSIHNGNGNAKVRARMVAGEYGVRPWTSEEKVYQGYINLNDIRGRYRRTQRDVFATREEVSHIVRAGETYPSLARSYSVDVEDLARLNENRVLQPGMEIRVPSKLGLPRLAPEVLFLDEQGMWVENPYKVEIVPNSVRTKDGKRMSDALVFLETNGIEVKRAVSPSVSITVTRGPVMNGKEALGHSHVRDILSVVDEDGVTYTKRSGSIGDYMLEGNYISWSATGQTTKEPGAGKRYTVTYTYDLIEELTVSFDSEHRERAGFDVLWRSEDVLTFEGIVTPEEDMVMDLPPPSSFFDWAPGIRATDYVVEDNDLWVKTSVEERDGKKVVVASMEGRDPRRNWHPEMNTGFYYLGDEEYYLYSEPIEGTYGRGEIPTVTNARYEAGSIFLSEETENLLEDGRLEEMVRRRKTFAGATGQPFTHL